MSFSVKILKIKWLNRILAGFFLLVIVTRVVSKMRKNRNMCPNKRLKKRWVCQWTATRIIDWYIRRTRNYKALWFTRYICFMLLHVKLPFRLYIEMGKDRTVRDHGHFSLIQSGSALLTKPRTVSLVSTGTRYSWNKDRSWSQTRPSTFHLNSFSVSNRTASASTNRFPTFPILLLSLMCRWTGSQSWKKHHLKTSFLLSRYKLPIY